MAVYGELGHLLVILWWKESILKYWNRTCSEEAPALLRAAMNLSLHNAISGRKCWVVNVDTLLNNAGYDGTFSELIVLDQHTYETQSCAHTVTSLFKFGMPV